MKTYPILKIAFGDEYRFNQETLMNFLSTIDFNIFHAEIINRIIGNEVSYIVKIKDSKH